MEQDAQVRQQQVWARFQAAVRVRHDLDQDLLHEIVRCRHDLDQDLLHEIDRDQHETGLGLHATDQDLLREHAPMYNPMYNVDYLNLAVARPLTS